MADEVNELRAQIADLKQKLERSDRQVMALADALDQVQRGAESIGQVAEKLRLEALR